MSAKRGGTTYYYRDYTDDFVESARQDDALPEDFHWIHRNPFYRLISALLYGVAVVFSLIYIRLILHVRVENRKVLKAAGKTGCFLYGNHTQPMGDVFGPVLNCFPGRISAIASVSNQGIPVIGKLLPMLGALFIPDSMGRMKEFMEAVRYHVEKKRYIVIYPEAHVWPWCTFIRPFPATAFRFPVLYNVPAFCMTTTYQQRKHGGKPKIVVYIDGPFLADSGKSKREQQMELHDKIFACMQSRSQASDCEYIHYQKREQDEMKNPADARR
ncbi:MAG: 1-acyl-sn-glycerol-3-phosphate acyltransferase [Lachnospiraceae bacterium]|nr:1-acyl-sn-glycerol-3-phosphate acyltransferase [Lachnospiraceae bacterium]